jgi:hypothetical protein
MNAFILMIALTSMDLAFTVVHFAIYNRWFVWLPTAVLVLIFLTASVTRVLHVSSRIVILEDEFRSIHSCSIIWEATALVHFKALDCVGLLDPNRKVASSFHGYTKALGDCTSDILREPHRPSELHQWIGEARREIFNKMTH